MDGYLIALIVLIVWMAILIAGARTGSWKKIHFQLYWNEKYGPFLMIKTVRGRRLLDRLARSQRFWTVYGKVSIGITIGSMIAMIVLLIWEFFRIFSLPPGFAPPLEQNLAIPVINPIIPLWYGIIGLVVTIFIHEFSHGILARVAKIKIESLGILLLVFPMGAFVEPDENEIKTTSRQKRIRMFAVGPGTNVIAAAICLIVLVGILAPSAKPVSDGAIVIGTTSGSPADHFGISAWSEILSVDNQSISKASDLNAISFDRPGFPVSTEISYGGSRANIDLPGGVVVTSVTAGLPAYNAGLIPGMIIVSLNDTTVRNLTVLRSVIENSTHNMPVNITVLKYGYDPLLGKNWYVEDENITNISLTSKWLAYNEFFPEQNREEFKNQSYMGVGTSVLGIRAENADYIMSLYSKPFGQDPATSIFKLLALPFAGFTPVEGAMAAIYEPTGIFASLPSDFYWILFNSFYWIFWMNFLVGTFNALPINIFDGGQVLTDFLRGFFERLNSKRIGLEAIAGKKPLAQEQIERFIGLISLLISLAIAFLIAWLIIGPRII